MITIRKHEDAQQVWENCINPKLIEWFQDPSRLAEKELIPPCLEAIEAASSISRYFSDQGITAPDRMVPDGDGGIVMEWWLDESSESLEISSVGQIEYIKCSDHRVIQRQNVTINKVENNGTIQI